ncbi:RES superfamily protein [Candidatus Fermentibacteria bacterium]|nr:MAG: RES superfamily protein [Candidatus Fermentibacteria bacterium]
MQVFRLAKEKYAEDLSGHGARLAGGRWNRSGVPALYTAESIALTVLEYLVHVPLGLKPDKLKIVTISIPDNAPGTEIPEADLPADWNIYPFPPETAAMGSEWLESEKGLYLKVPSAVVPLCSNIILNPGHPLMGEVKIERTGCFKLDPRLLRQVTPIGKTR